MIIPPKYIDSSNHFMVDPVQIRIDGMLTTIDRSSLPQNFDGAILADQELREEISSWRKKDSQNEQAAQEHINKYNSPQNISSQEKTKPSLKIVIYGHDHGDKRQRDLRKALFGIPTQERKDRIITVTVNQQNISLDVCLEDDLRSHAINPLKTADIVLLVVDLAKGSTFNNLNEFITHIQTINEQHASTPIILVADDTAAERENMITQKTLDHFTQQSGLRFFMTSSTTGDNIKSLLEHIVTRGIAQKQEYELQRITKEQIKLSRAFLKELMFITQQRSQEEAQELAKHNINRYNISSYLVELGELFEKVNIDKLSNDSLTALQRKINTNQSYPIQKLRDEAVNTLFMRVEQSKSFLQGIKIKIQESLWDTKGIGLFGKKPPHHITKLRELLKGIDIKTLDVDNIIKLQTKAAEILNDTNHPKKRRDTEVIDLYENLRSKMPY